MNNTLIIKTYPRATPWSHASMRWRIVLDGRGYYAEEWFDINKLTPEERIAYDSEHDDPEFDAYMLAQTPRFASIADAEAWASVLDEEESIETDLRAFHAPSECYDMAFRHVEIKRIELMERSLQHINRKAQS